MGGFCAVFDWERPVVRASVDTMLGLIPHRSAGGAATVVTGHAALGEAHTGRAVERPAIAQLGRFTLVGDLRLWNVGGLRSRAGGAEATQGMDDRHLILAAYARTGAGFLDDLDGDFAFVIWDGERRRALAVRDRFAAKPLFYERTSTGIRFATEAKQLVATSSDRPEPNDAAVAEYLRHRYVDRRHTFFAGVRKVQPATYLLAEPNRTVEHRYWSPAFDADSSLSEAAVADRFRGLLTDSVRWRAETARGVVAHLSGGLDSPAITAAASIGRPLRGSVVPFHTVSAVFPGLAADESKWIHEIAANQPFPHHDFVPESESVEGFSAVMWQADSPVHNRIRGIWQGTARIARSTGADLVLMGSGGDEVLDQDWLLSDLVRSGHMSKWLAAVRSEAAWYGVPPLLRGALDSSRSPTDSQAPGTPRHPPTGATRPAARRRLIPLSKPPTPLSRTQTEL